MIEIIGIYALRGNGGIASWTKKFLKTFPDEEFTIYPLSNGSKKIFTEYKNSVDRAYHGILALIELRKEVIKTIKAHPGIKIMHITTSAGQGVVRDWVIMNLCHRYGIKCIMHCRFGSIKELYQSKSLWGHYFRKNVKYYDQTWVLDSPSYNFLSSIPENSERIFLTPNSIEVQNRIDILRRKLKHIGFVGNILETKGIFELVTAVSKSMDDFDLTIAGFGADADITKIKELSANHWGNKIKYVGKLPNDEAVKLMNSLDIIALPTYYPGEAFPISILEAMSLGKLVLSCPRAAIPDMLTAIDGTKCGLLVAEKSIDEIIEALHWISQNNDKCLEMCEKAFEKVYEKYRMEVVYDIYRANYHKLLS